MKGASGCQVVEIDEELGHSIIAVDDDWAARSAEEFLGERRKAYEHLLESADLDRLLTDRQYEADLQAEAEQMAAAAMQREEPEAAVENMKADLVNASDLPNQAIWHGSRTYRRSVTEIHKTVTGVAGKVRIKGRYYLARHWFGDCWATGRSWDAMPRGL